MDTYGTLTPVSIKVKERKPFSYLISVINDLVIHSLLAENANSSLSLSLYIIYIFYVCVLAIKPIQPTMQGVLRLAMIAMDID